MDHKRKIWLGIANTLYVKRNKNPRFNERKHGRRLEQNVWNFNRTRESQHKNYLKNWPAELVARKCRTTRSNPLRQWKPLPACRRLLLIQLQPSRSPLRPRPVSAWNYRFAFCFDSSWHLLSEDSSDTSMQTCRQ